MAYSPQAKGGSFRPATVASRVQGLKENASRQERAMAEFGRQLRINGQTEVQNAKQKGSDLKALGAFSKTIAEEVERIEKRTAEDIEIGKTYDFFMGGFKDEAADDQMAEGEAQGALVSEVSNTIEQNTKDPTLANHFRNTHTTPLAAGVQGEQVMLMQAQTTYGSWLSTFMQSDQVINLNGVDFRARDIAGSGDPSLVAAAMSKARWEFIRANNLQYVSKRGFVKYLGQTIVSNEASISNGLVTSAIKTNRDNTKENLSGLGYAMAQTGDVEGVSSSFHELSSQFYRQNTGLDRRGANEAAVEALIQGYEDAGNVDALRALQDVQQVPGQKGSELRNVYGNKINDAIVRAQRTNDQRGARAVKDIEALMYRDLAGATNEEQRAVVIENAAQQMEQNGEYQKARELRGQYKELSVAGNAERNEAIVSDAITDGAITTQQELDRLKAKGDITQEGFNRLSKELSGSNGGPARKNPIVKDVVDDYADSFDTRFSQAIGIKRDQFGQLPDVLADETTVLLDASDARLIMGQARRDIERVANTIVNGNPGMNEAQLQTELHKGLTQWLNENTKEKTGKYYIQDIVDRQEARANVRIDGPEVKLYEPYMKNRFTNLLSNPESLVSLNLFTTSPIAPKDFSPLVYPNQPISSTVKQSFRPLRGDKVFNAVEVESMSSDWAQGKVNGQLRQAAQSLGMSPLALLNSQLRAFNKPTFLPVVQSSSTGIAPTGSVSGANQIMQMGIPSKGAAYLAGNIQQESGWNGQRRWDDGGQTAGGLVSWRAGRLANAEAWLGKPIEQATPQEQLNYMLHELKTVPAYAEANRIFRNPYATERQLIRASRIYWGYGEQGDRYVYGRNTAAALRGNQTGNRKQMTISKGIDLVNKGYSMWQHPNFHYEHGYVEGGGQEVSRSQNRLDINSSHLHDEALDFPLSHNTEHQLQQIEQELRADGWIVKRKHDHIHAEPPR